MKTLKLIIVCVLTITVFPLFTVDALQQKKIRMSGADVERTMLEKGYTVQQARITSDVAKQNIPQAKSIYDTNLSADVSHQIDKSAKASPIFGDRIDTTTWGIGVDRKFPTGTQAGVAFSSDRLEYYNSLVVNNQPIFPPNALYEPIISFTVSQPVLKNAGGYIDRRSVKSAELGSLAVELATQREIETLVYGALTDYWNLVLIRRDIIAKQKSVNFAQQFLSTTLEEFKLGTAEETDVLAAKANVLVRKDELMAVEEVERVWHENLRVKLGMGPDIFIENIEKVPPFVKFRESVEKKIDYALNNRKDYMASKRELEVRNVELAMAKNARWPSMDLYSTLELNEIDTSYTSALKSTDSPNFTVGMNFSIPLENRAARSEKRKADLERARALIALKDLENRISNGVVRNYEEVVSREKIVKQSQQALNLQVEKLKQEMKKYSMGRSTSDLIVRYQDDAVNAERMNLDAWLSYKKAVLDLLLSEGKLVGAHEAKQAREDEEVMNPEAD